MFYREILVELNRWKIKTGRKPLIIRGARQTGKTTIVKEFAKTFQYFISFNLDKSEELALFEKQISFVELVREIFFINNVPLESNDVLIFIDEIQNSPRAIKNLRYFYEEYPNLFVISAGSLLESVLNKNSSFPVGRVEYMFLHPFSFSEFLLAMGETSAHKEFHNIPVSNYAHEKLLKLFHTFAMIGAMPEAIKAYIQTQDILKVKDVYESLYLSFLDDVEKYSSNEKERRIIRHLISTAPISAGVRIKYEGFGNSNYSSREISEAMSVLLKTMFLHLLRPITSVELPAVPDLKKSPKLQLLDSGFVNYSNSLYRNFIGIDDLNKIYKGFLIEQLCIQEYRSSSNFRTEINFWVREKNQSNAEIDLIHNTGKYLIPIEVKSGKQGTLRSLHQFVNIAPHNFAIRLYAGSLALEEHITPEGKSYRLLNLPYYLGSKIADYCDYYSEG